MRAGWETACSRERRRAFHAAAGVAAHAVSCRRQRPPGASPLWILPFMLHLPARQPVRLAWQASYWAHGARLPGRQPRRCSCSCGVSPPHGSCWGLFRLAMARQSCRSSLLLLADVLDLSHVERIPRCTGREVGSGRCVAGWREPPQGPCLQMQHAEALQVLAAQMQRRRRSKAAAATAEAAAAEAPTAALAPATPRGHARRRRRGTQGSSGAAPEPNTASFCTIVVSSSPWLDSMKMVSTLTRLNLTSLGGRQRGRGGEAGMGVQGSWECRRRPDGGTGGRGLVWPGGVEQGAVVRPR